MSHPFVIITTVDDDTLAITCDDCSLAGSSACADCVVTFLLERDPDDAVVLDVSEARALRLLSGAGLVPTLRHTRRVG